MKIAAMLLTLLLTCSAVGAKEIQTYVYLGTTRVVISIKKFREGPVFIALHDSEAKDVERVPGTLVKLHNWGSRNVHFWIGNTEYAFDPNRIFSTEGVETTLKNIGKNYSLEAHRAVESLAWYLEGLIAGKAVIALHRNRDRGYSVEWYQPGGVLANEAARVQVVPELDPDDFVLVVKEEDYQRWSTRNANVVLQDNESANKGSLSGYAAQVGLRYINLEVQRGREHDLASVKIQE